MEQLTPNKESLIAIDEARQPHPGVGKVVDAAVQEPRGIDPHTEAAADHAAPLETPLHFRQCAWFQDAIGMQKEEDFSRRLGRSQVHLPSPAAHTDEQSIRCLGDRTSSIVAAAVDHENLVRPLFTQELQCSAQAAFLVESRYDNRNAHELTACRRTLMSEPWYKDGLPFSCTRCGHCCTGEPGFVWVNDEEIAAIANVRGESVEQVAGLYVKPAGRRRSLREKENGDCVFYERDRGCTIYEVRPRQCRTWPFWESNLSTPERWQETCEICPGSGKGDLIPVEEIIRRLKVIRI